MADRSEIRLTERPNDAPETYLGLPFAGDLARLEADVAILGIPYGRPYWPHEPANPQSRAPDLLRAFERCTEEALTHHDFDLGGTLLGNPPGRVVDCGNVSTSLVDPVAHYSRAEAAVRAILATGAVPLVIGGDHGVPIPVLRALEGQGPITLVQIDAHIDWRDEVEGEREGYSSPIRRASEMPWIERILQIGIRGTGSARAEEVAAAQAWGAEIVTAREMRARGIVEVLATIPEAARTYLTVDADGLDPSIMPGVMAQAPGGLLWPEIEDVLMGLTSRTRLIGMDLVELAPERDPTGLTLTHASRLVRTAIGLILRARHGAG